MRNVTSCSALSILLCALAPTIALAQSTINPFELEYTYSSPSEGDFEDEIEIHEGKVGAIIPLASRKDNGFGFGVGGQFQMNVWSPDSDNIEDVELYKVKIPVLTDFDLSKSLSLALGVIPGIHSDFEEVDSDDWRVDGNALFSYATSEELTFMLGASISEEFGEAEAFPIGGLRWIPNKSWLLDIFFPRPRIQYSLAEGVRFFLFGEPSGGEWNVGDKDTQIDIQQKGFRAGVGMDFRVAKSSWLYLAVGAEGGRELQVALDGNEVFDDEVDLDDQSFFRIGYKIER